MTRTHTHLAIITTPQAMTQLRFPDRFTAERWCERDYRARLQTLADDDIPWVRDGQKKRVALHCGAITYTVQLDKERR